MSRQHQFTPKNMQENIEAGKRQIIIFLFLK